MFTSVAAALPVGAAVVSLSVVAGLCISLQPAWAVRWAQKHWPNVLFYHQTREPVIALTIDDGPHRDITPELLRILKENDCRATWFVIGSNMDKCPELVAQMHMEGPEFLAKLVNKGFKILLSWSYTGHEVGNHTMYDVASWKLPPEEFEKQLLAVDERLNDLYFKNAANQRIKWFRPGHGVFTKKMLEITEAHGYRTALGSLFPLDTLFANQGRNIAKYLVWKIECGAIIILHDRGPQRIQTAEVLKALLPELKKRGYSVLTISELLKLKAN